MKYANYQMVFREIPNEITLAINISNCPCHCPGCHSPYLAEDIGEELTPESLKKLYFLNKGITCIAFMGGDSDPAYINYLAKFIRDNGPEINIAWYSGRQELSKDIDLSNFDYIKLGPYIEELGPLDNPCTNQRFYIVNSFNQLDDITFKFWNL